MLKWNIKEIELPLKFPWHIARGSCESKTNFIIEVSNGLNSGMGEVAFTQRYDESAQKVRDGFQRFIDNLPSHVERFEQIVSLCIKLNLPRSLSFGIESAFVRYLSSISGRKVHEFLGVNTVRSINTSFSLPIMEVENIKKFIQVHGLQRFSSLKIKIEKETALETIKEVHKYYMGNIRLDANESWTNPDDVIRFAEKLGKKLPIEFLEQPLGANCHDESLYLKKNINIPLIADESIQTQDITEYYVERFDGVNIKLMKSGSYLRAIRQLRDARDWGLKTMLGCMVETSLGISSALDIAYNVDYLDLDGFLLIQKDPFEIVSEENGKLFYSQLH